MSATDSRIHKRIEWLVAQANDFLPNDVVLGYALMHTHDEQSGALIADAELIRADGDLKRMMRQELGRRVVQGWGGADTDLASLPADAATLSDVVVIFDLFHKPTGISVVRTYSLATLRNLATRDDLTNEQKRQAVRNQLQDFYNDLLARIAQV